MEWLIGMGLFLVVGVSVAIVLWKLVLKPKTCRSATDVQSPVEPEDLEKALKQAERVHHESQKTVNHLARLQAQADLRERALKGRGHK